MLSSLSHASASKLPVPVALKLPSERLYPPEPSLTISQTANWNAARLATLKQYASGVAVDTLLGLTLNPSSLDWTPKAGSPATTGGVTAPSARVAGYFGGTWANTTYLGAADPAGTKWWQGWTYYAIN